MTRKPFNDLHLLCIHEKLRFQTFDVAEDVCLPSFVHNIERTRVIFAFRKRNKSIDTHCRLDSAFGFYVLLILKSIGLKAERQVEKHWDKSSDAKMTLSNK